RIMVRKACKARYDRIVRWDCFEARYNARRSCPIGMDQQNVEADDGRTEFIEPINQLGQKRPRPGPLAKAFDAFLVDIHYSDGDGLVLPRLKAQKLIKNSHAELNERLGLAYPS